MIRKLWRRYSIRHYRVHCDMYSSSLETDPYY